MVQFYQIRKQIQSIFFPLFHVQKQGTTFIRVGIILLNLVYI